MRVETVLVLRGGANMVNLIEILLGRRSKTPEAEKIEGDRQRRRDKHIGALYRLYGRRRLSSLGGWRILIPPEKAEQKVGIASADTDRKQQWDDNLA
jgi:hypothetical protein